VHGRTADCKGKKKTCRGRKIDYKLRSRKEAGRKIGLLDRFSPSFLSFFLVLST
jgi:hypothetical protein